MSRACETCPMYGGMLKLGEDLSVCGNPVPECEDYREQLHKKVEAWFRLSRIAELGRGGVLDMRLLQPGDELVLYASDEDERPYGGLDYWLGLEVESVQPNGSMLASVIRDNIFSDDGSTDERGIQWHLADGEPIRIIGSTTDGEQTNTGFLHVGRSIIYERADCRYWGVLLQEVVLIDPSGTDMNVWDTDPLLFHPASNNLADA